MMTVLVKYVGQHIPIGEVVFVRSVLALTFTLFMMRREGVRTLGKNIPLLFLRGIVGFSAIICFYYAIPRLNLADATVIQYTNPVFVVIFAAIFLKERIGSREITSVVLCILGVALIARPTFVFGDGPSIDPRVLMIALGGAILSGAAYAIVRKLRETDHALNVILFFPLVSIPASLPMFVTRIVWPTTTEWLLLIGIAVTSQFGQVFMTKAYHTAAAAKASTASYTQIIFAVLWGILLFSEIPTIWMIAGTILVGTGTAIVSFGKR